MKKTTVAGGYAVKKATIAGKHPVKKIIWLVAVAVVVLGAGTAIYFKWRQGDPPPEQPPVETTQSPPSPSPANAEPVIRHPIEEVAPAQPLPALGESDPAMSKSLAELFGKNRFAKLFYPDRIIRRIVATIDNLPRKSVTMNLMPVKPVPGIFIVAGPESDTVIGTKNAARYALYVKLLQAVDAKKLVAFYVNFYPLFQQDYVDLGYPKGYFNDRLIEAIDNILVAPDLKEPIMLVQPKVMYEFADPDIETCSAGQKTIMRMGSENAAKIKAKLREIRHELILRSPLKPK